jgi:hypothetical protein
MYLVKYIFMNLEAIQEEVKLRMKQDHRRIKSDNEEKELL